MVPLPTPTAEVAAVAKKNLKPGDILDEIGQFTYRAWIMRADEARAQQAIPCGLLSKARVTAPIAKGELITTANTQVPADSKIAALRARQDAMLGLV
jgi:predicted homoserine dehydrogenase-like protein